LINPPEKQEKFNLETGISRLEQILSRLEGEDDLPLEEALNLFQQGTQILKECRKCLSEAEFRVKVLLENGSLQDFSEGESG